MADVAGFNQYMPLALSHASNQTPEMNGVELPGGIIPFLAEDLRFALDQIETLDREDPVLKGYLDVSRAGVFGMSLGGYVGPEACRLDVMIISRDAEIMRQERTKAGGWPEPEIAHTIGDQRALFEHNRDDSYYLTMNQMYHVNWTDAPIWSPIVNWMGLAGPIDPYRGFAETNAYTLAFFDCYLNGRPSPLLDGAHQSQSEPRLEVRRAR